jgi:hypothetical protein
MNIQSFDRWLPVGFRFSSSVPSVLWIDVGSKQLTEPFFGQTIWNLRSELSTSQRTTGIEELLEIADSFPSITPAAIILHISRCGSTLLTNVFKAGGECTTLSEAAVIDSLVRQHTFTNISGGIEEMNDMRARLLRAVVSLYTACFGMQVVIKAHTTHILHMSRLRSAWESVPLIVNIRNPVEVMSSNLAGPADWLKSILNPYDEPNVFGFTGPETRRMTMEEYCARGIGTFLEAADDGLDERCWVLDYTQMSLDNIYKVARLINLDLPPTHAGQILSAYQIYSKDPAKVRLHVNDSAQKQNNAAPSVHELSLKWATKPYHKLLAKSIF